MTARIVALCCILASLLASCRSSPPADVGSGSMPPGVPPSGTPSVASSPGRPPVIRSTPALVVTPSPTQGTQAPEVYRTTGSVDDTRGDAGTESRPYNDLVGVRIQDDGTRARILVRLGAEVPNPMPDGEQMGVGVDLYRTGTQKESDYQVFAAGTDQGWLAFLQTPDGFVEYPGTFAIGGGIIEFVVPWSALGGRSSGHFSSFLDWDREAIAISLAGQDLSPDEGRRTYAR